MEFPVHLVLEMDVVISEEKIYNLLHLYVTHDDYHERASWLFNCHRSDSERIAKVWPIPENVLVFRIPPQSGTNFTVVNEMVFVFDAHVIKSGLQEFANEYPAKFYDLMNNKSDVATVDLFWRCVHGMKRNSL